MPLAPTYAVLRDGTEIVKSYNIELTGEAAFCTKAEAMAAEKLYARTPESLADRAIEALSRAYARGEPVAKTHYSGCTGDMEP